MWKKSKNISNKCEKIEKYNKEDLKYKPNNGLYLGPSFKI